MITRAQFDEARRRARALLQKTGIVLREDELERMEVADVGLGELEESGLQIVTLVDTEKIAAKLLVLLPDQTFPEHRHPPVGRSPTSGEGPRLGEYPGKEETIRLEWGELYVMLPGEATPDPRARCQHKRRGARPAERTRARPPAHRRKHYTCWNEAVLRPGQQLTVAPDVPHWFQAGPEGAVAWSFSTKATDVDDVFTDPEVRRKTVIEDEAG